MYRGTPRLYIVYNIALYEIHVNRRAALEVTLIYLSLITARCAVEEPVNLQLQATIFFLIQSTIIK